MNLTDLRDALDELADPPQTTLEVSRQRVQRRIERARIRGGAGLAVAILMVSAATLAIAAPWSDGNKSTPVVAGSSRTIHDDRFGYSVTVPPGWQRETADGRDSKSLPIILQLTSGYRPPVIGRDCATSVEQTGIKILVQEFESMFPAAEPRPAKFGEQSGSGLATVPSSPLCRRLAQGINFVDQGRSFAVAVTVGPGTAETQKAEVYEILNSLHFDPTNGASQVASGIALPAYKVPKDGYYPQAGFRGVLERRGPCVYFESSDRLLVWSPGTKLLRRGSNWIVEGASGSTLPIGTEVSLGGGEIPDNAPSVSGLKTKCPYAQLVMINPSQP
jgi:hypothetical protein